MMRFSVMLAVMAGAACSPESPPPTEAAAPPELRAPPAASPAAPRAIVPASSASELSADGLGPLRIGMTLAEVQRVYGPDADPAAVGGPDPAACDQFRPARAPTGVIVMIENDRLTRISLTDQAEVQTDRGLAIGAAAAQVRSAYGAALKAETHKYSEPPAAYLTHWLRGGDGVDYVQSPAARGVRYETDDKERVIAIHAGGPSIQYVEGCL